MLRLGFLQCDSLDTPHVEVAGDYEVLFGDLLAPHPITLVTYRADKGELPLATSDCDAWLIPGSRQSVYDDLPWITGLAHFTSRLLDDASPLVGVCFGHQLIAKVLGAPVAKADVGWSIGAIDYQLQQVPPGETTIADPFTLIASHQDQVLELPSGTELLATSSNCPIAGFGTDSVLTMQAHPEFNAPLADSLYRSRIERIGREPIETALNTLSKPLDRQRVADWIAAFVLERAGS